MIIKYSDNSTRKIPISNNFIFSISSNRYQFLCVCTNSVLVNYYTINPLNPELNPICYLLALLGAHHFLHVSRIRVKLLTFRLLMSYIDIWSTHS